MKKASEKSIGVAKLTRPRHRVAIQQKICTAPGMAIIMLAAVKKLLPSSGIWVANM